MKTKLYTPTAALTWAQEMFGDIVFGRRERAARFLEEALELAQACELPLDDVDALVERTYSRKAGKIARELGQAQMTLDILSSNEELVAADEAKAEFDRVQSFDRNYWQGRHKTKPHPKEGERS